MYRITITKVIENPDYEKPEFMGYSPRGCTESTRNSKMIETEALTMDLTEEEFKAVKKACLDTM